MIKKVITFGICVCIIFFLLLACSDDVVSVSDDNSGSVTLESIRNTLTEAGYTIIENTKFSPENSVGTVIFSFDGSHSKINIPVIEFTDKESAGEYAKIINADGTHLAIVNDKFLTMAEAHNGTAHEIEKTFFENLIKGKPIK